MGMTLEDFLSIVLELFVKFFLILLKFFNLFYFYLFECIQFSLEIDKVLNRFTLKLNF